MTGNIYEFGGKNTNRLEKLSTPNVSVIILNWNGWKDTLECLESFFKISYENYNIIVVDNKSEAEDVVKIRRYCEGESIDNLNSFRVSKNNKPIRLLEYGREISELGGDPTKEKAMAEVPSCRKLRLILNEENYGFAEGCNIGIRYSIRSLNPDYLLLLNNDTIVDQFFLNELINIAENDENIGVVGPMIYYYDYPKKIESIGSKLNLWTGGFNRIGADKIDRGQYMENLEVDFVSGAALLIKRKVVEEIGLIYPLYFAYWEETDWCSRAKTKGFKIYSIPKAKIWHKVSKSISFFSPFRVYLILRNNILFMRRCAPVIYLPSFLIFYFTIRIWIYALGLYKSKQTKNFAQIFDIISRSVRDGFSLEIMK